MVTKNYHSIWNKTHNVAVAAWKLQKKIVTIEISMFDHFKIRKEGRFSTLVLEILDVGKIQVCNVKV